MSNETNRPPLVRGFAQGRHCPKCNGPRMWVRIAQKAGEFCLPCVLGVRLSLSREVIAKWHEDCAALPRPAVTNTGGTTP